MHRIGSERWLEGPRDRRLEGGSTMMLKIAQRTAGMGLTHDNNKQAKREVDDGSRDRVDLRERRRGEWMWRSKTCKLHQPVAAKSVHHAAPKPKQSRSPGLKLLIERGDRHSAHANCNNHCVIFEGGVQHEDCIQRDTSIQNCSYDLAELRSRRVVT